MPKQTFYSVFVVHLKMVAVPGCHVLPYLPLFLPAGNIYLGTLAGRLGWPPTGWHLLLAPFVDTFC